MTRYNEILEFIAMNNHYTSITWDQISIKTTNSEYNDDDVVDDDAYYWVYLSPDHPFQVHYINCDSLFYDKVRQICYCKVHQVLLRDASGTTKCDDYHKVRQNMV